MFFYRRLLPVYFLYANQVITQAGVESVLPQQEVEFLQPEVR